MAPGLPQVVRDALAAPFDVFSLDDLFDCDIEKMGDCCVIARARVRVPNAFERTFGVVLQAVVLSALIVAGVAFQETVLWKAAGGYVAMMLIIRIVYLFFEKVPTAVLSTDDHVVSPDFVWRWRSRFLSDYAKCRKVVAVFSISCPASMRRTGGSSSAFAKSHQVGAICSDGDGGLQRSWLTDRPSERETLRVAREIGTLLEVDTFRVTIANVRLPASIDRVLAEDVATDLHASLES